MGKDIKNMTGKELYEKCFKYAKNKDKVTKSIDSMSFDEWEDYLMEKYGLCSMDLPAYGINATGDRYYIDYQLSDLSSKMSNIQNSQSQESKGDFSGFLMSVVVIAAGAFMLYMFCKGFS